MEDEQLTRNLVLSICEMKQQGSIPPACVAPQMATMGMKVYLFGGADERLFCSERQAWREVEAQGFVKPSPCYGHSMTAFNQTLIVFGGMEQTDDEITDQHPRFSPPPFTFHLNTEQPRLWCHQGTPSNSIMSFDVTTSSWSKLEIKNNAPSPRAFHGASLIHRSRGSVKVNMLVIWGGATDENLSKGSDDICILDLETNLWLSNIEQTGDVPTARFGHSLVYSLSRCCIFLFGGANNDGAVFALDCTPLLTAIPASSEPNLLGFTATFPNNAASEPSEKIILRWSKLDVTGTPPLPRSFHSLDIIGERLFVFAGLTVVAYSSDFYILDLNKNKWSRPLHDGDINLSGHGSAILHDKLLIFGGSKGSSLELSYKDVSPSSSAAFKGPRLSRKLFFLSVLEIKTTMNSGDLRFKLVTVGDSGVGKSCLLRRFAQDTYADNHVATIGVDFCSVVTMVKGKIVTMQLWDTAGQERFGGVTSNYYRNADGFILVYDSTRRDSFEHILYWIESIKEHHDFGPNTLKLLIGNKQDLVGQMKVNHDEAKKLADSIGAIYLGTSARTGAGVDTAFLLAAGQLLEFRRRTGSQAKGYSPNSDTFLPSSDISLNSGSSSPSLIHSGFCSAC